MCSLATFVLFFYTLKTKRATSPLLRFTVLYSVPLPPGALSMSHILQGWPIRIRSTPFHFDGSGFKKIKKSWIQLLFFFWDEYRHTNRAYHDRSRCNGSRLMGQIHHICINKSQTYTVASAPVVNGLLFFRIFWLFLGQCAMFPGGGGGVL